LHIEGSSPERGETGVLKKLFRRQEKGRSRNKVFENGKGGGLKLEDIEFRGGEDQKARKKCGGDTKGWGEKPGHCSKAPICGNL